MPPNGQAEGGDGAHWDAGALAVQPLEEDPDMATAAMVTNAEEDHSDDAMGDDASSAAQECDENDSAGTANEGGTTQMETSPGGVHHPPTRVPSAADENTLQQLRTVVANLTCALSFTRRMASLQPLLRQLLASATESDVKEGIKLLQLCACFHVEGAQEGVREALPLVFKGEDGVHLRVLWAKLQRMWFCVCVCVCRPYIVNAPTTLL